MSPATTTSVEMTKARNQTLPHVSRSWRINLSKANDTSELIGIDRNSFFFTSLEMAGAIYVLVIILCIWEFTMGIKESIKDIFRV